MSARLDPAALGGAPLMALLACLDRDGEAARVVGGAVRDGLLGLPVREIDVATTALPEIVMARADAAGFRSVPTGIAHGTVTVIAGGVPFEVTTLREDVETDGRHAVVRFGRDWAHDAARRDFTINALSVDRSGHVHDLVGGLADLAARRVRFIGDAHARIREDYLRALRFFRFTARYAAGAIDPDGLAAVIGEQEGLDRLSRERVGAEILGLLGAPHVLAMLEAMEDAGITLRVFAGVTCRPVLARLIAIEAAAGLPADPVLRLAAYGVAVREDAERLKHRLKLSNAAAGRLLAGVDRAWPEISETAAKALLYRLGPEAFADMAALGFARSGAAPDDRAWADLLSLPRRWRAPSLPFSADRLIAVGLRPGPGLGRAMRLAEARWVAAGFPQDEAALARIIAESAAAAREG